jgi:hypothetical protein
MAIGAATDLALAGSGARTGTLTNPDGDLIQIQVLWGLIFGEQAAGTRNTRPTPARFESEKPSKRPESFFPLPPNGSKVSSNLLNR